MRLAFTVPGKPQPKERARLGKGGRWYTPSATRRYERAVKRAARGAVLSQGYTWPVYALMDGAKEVHVEMVIYMPDRRPRDVDNVVKAVLDGCNRVVWRDDRQVRKVTAERELDRERPRVEVTIEVVEEGSEAA